MIFRPRKPDEPVTKTFNDSSYTFSPNGSTRIVTLIVPFYGAQQAADAILAQISAQNRGRVNVKWILVDNGSSPPIIFSSRTPESVKILRLDANRMYGGAVKFAANFAEPCSHIGWMPGNGKVTAGDVISWLDAATLDPAAIAKARRIRKNRVESTKTAIASLFLTILTGIRVSDPGGTPTLFPKRHFKKFIENAPDGIEIEAYTLGWSQKAGIEVVRPAIEYGPRTSGKSTWRRGIVSELRMLGDFSRALKKAKSYSDSAR